MRVIVVQKCENCGRYKTYCDGCVESCHDFISQEQFEYEQSLEMMQYNIMYEPTYNQNDGSM